MATGSLIYFPKQSKRTTPRKSKPTDKKKPAAKATVLDWIRNGYQFPGKPAPPISNPEPQKRDEGGVR